ncbi:hypothetical protein AB0J86_09635 [Micromonospora sp. NPDC049559]|uniref:hypothetical protein n=1 Tax=Micromonospora sp. NPDC049559 TaxID=3155923 RepID=UPI00342ACC2A
MLEMYRRTRPRDVPVEMVEAATARRLAGDVAGACAAARVDLDVNVAEIARWHGRETADRIVDDLQNVAPDLLRWNLPRDVDNGAPIGFGLLRRYPAGGGANLMISTVRNQPGRLKLWVQCRREGTADLPDRVPGMYHLPQAYWDIRCTGELRGLCGGGPDRIPFHGLDGRLLDTAAAEARPDDPVAMTEWLTLLWDEGRTGEALAACGITLADGERVRWPQRPWVAIERLVADGRRALDEGVFERGLSVRRPRSARTIWVECRDEGQAGTDIELTFGSGRRVTARLRSAPVGESRLLTAPEYRHPIDLDLLRFGLAGPEDLHPAITRALFPTRAAGTDRPSNRGAEGRPGPSGAVAARAGGWELMERAAHRDTAGVVALLDAGADPLVRDSSGQTLLHLLPHLDHELLLARLLAAGVDVNAVDMQGHTALHAAVMRRQELEHAGSMARKPVEDLIGRLRNAGGVDVCRERGAPCPADEVTERRVRPTAEDVDRLRAAASRHRYRSMAELAWALYSVGKDRREVLAECYGAPLPDEFFALADHLPLPGYKDLQCHVWRLALPANRGGPVPPTDSSLDDYDDEVAFERDPQLVPVLRLHDHHTEYGGFVLCYRLTDLARGEPTVFGTDPLDDDGRIERLGPSLLAVLDDYHATIVDRLEMLRRLAPQRDDVDALPVHRAALNLVRTLLPAGAAGVPRSELTAPFTKPVSERTLVRLRGGASRDDYRSMGRLAWALYAAGLAPHEVLAECYGVEFPREFFVVAEAGPGDVLPGDETNLPWNLAVPLERGGPAIRPRPSMWRAERRIFAWDPDLVPLLTLYGDDRVDHGAKEPQPRVPHGGLIHCYRLSELAVGRSTVVGVSRHAANEGRELSVEPCGPSLLTVLHEYVVARHRLDEWEIAQPWNRGAGSIDDMAVEESLERVAEIESLQHELAERTGATGK